MLPLLLLTFRGAIRSGHNNNTVQKQILKKLLENHGISDIGDLKCVLQINQLWEKHYNNTIKCRHYKKKEEEDPTTVSVVETSKENYLKLIKAEETSLLADLLGNWSNGVIGFGHFARFPLRHTLFQPMDPWGTKTEQRLVCAGEGRV